MFCERCRYITATGPINARSIYIRTLKNTLKKCSCYYQKCIIYKQTRFSQALDWEKQFCVSRMKSYRYIKNVFKKIALSMCIRKTK